MFIHDVFVLNRHVLTAAHCLCTTLDHGYNHYPCLKGDQNQMLPGQNEITIYGGRRYQSYKNNKIPKRRELGKYFWKVSKAYTMPMTNLRFSREDIGIAQISEHQCFFP